MTDDSRSGVPLLVPPIVASPAKRIEAFAGDPNFMTSLARGLAVVHAFQERKRHLTIAQISHRTEIPRAAVRRCLYTLMKLCRSRPAAPCIHPRPFVRRSWRFVSRAG